MIPEQESMQPNSELISPISQKEGVGLNILEIPGQEKSPEKIKEKYLGYCNQYLENLVKGTNWGGDLIEKAKKI